MENNFSKWYDKYMKKKGIEFTPQTNLTGLDDEAIRSVYKMAALVNQPEQNRDRILDNYSRLSGNINLQPTLNLGYRQTMSPKDYLFSEMMKAYRSKDYPEAYGLLTKLGKVAPDLPNLQKYMVRLRKLADFMEQ